MSRLVLRGMRAAGLLVAELDLGPGLFPILARPDAGATLVSALGGQLRNRAGTLTIDGADPQRSPAARARIALLLALEPVSEARTVRDGLAATLGGEAAAEAALSEVGLGAWAARNPRCLTPAERRSVALAAALAAEDPLLVALHEPLADVPGVDPGRVVSRLRELAAQRAVVIPVTSSVRDLLALGGDPFVLAIGAAFRATGPVTAASTGRDVELVAISPAARDLAAGLLARPEVEAVSYDEVTAPRRVRLRARDVRAGSLAILAVATEQGTSLTALSLEPPTLDSVEAAAMNAARASLGARPAAAPTRPDPWSVAMPFGVAPPPPPPPPGAPPALGGSADPTSAAADPGGAGTGSPEEA